MNKLYCFDTNLLIGGWHRIYRKDVFPEIWNRIGELIENDQAKIPWEVWKEIEYVDDDLTKWLGQFKPKLNRPTPDEQNALRDIMREIPNMAAQGKTTNAADPFVIAMAKALDGIVVTEESEQEKSKPTKSPKITYSCERLGVRWMRPIDFLAEVM